MSEEQAVIVEREGGVMVITLNRPDAMNAINGALSNGLWNAIQELDADDSLVAGVITGSGRAFCAGMDLKAFARGEDIGPLNTFVRSGAKKPLIAAKRLRISRRMRSYAYVRPHRRRKGCKDRHSRSQGWPICRRWRRLSTTRSGGLRQGYGDGVNR